MRRQNPDKADGKDEIVRENPGIILYIKRAPVLSGCPFNRV